MVEPIPTKTIKVLLIEDSPDDAFLIKRLLVQSEYIYFQLEVVDLLNIGLERIATEPMDVVLLDLNVPDSSGLDTLLAAQVNAPSVPIVVMTSLSDEALGIRAVQEGAQDYLVKGEVDSNVLIRAISYAIERKQAERELRRHRDHLEELVAERTAALTQINVQLEREIIERQQAEAAEREQREFVEALRDISNALNTTHSLPEVLDRILAAVERLVHYDFGEVMLFEGGIARIVRAQGYDETSLNNLLDLRLNLEDTVQLHQMSQTREAVLVDDALSCPDEITIIQDAGWRSYVGLPIYHQDEAIGCISLMSFEPRFFNMVHVDRLQAFAEQAAIAIQNVRLYEQGLALAALQERERLARELHDAVSQSLFSAAMIAEALPRSWKRDPKRALARLSELHRLIRGALAEMRMLLLELRPNSLLEATFSDLVAQLVEAVQSRKSINVGVVVNEQCPIPADVKVALYRITQEALNNVVKHARATSASITLTSLPDHVDLAISDNGQGFDMSQIPSTSMGLSIMQERASAIKALLTIDSQPRQGTRIVVRWSNANAS